jgi:hypothetical protein
MYRSVACLLLVSFLHACSDPTEPLSRTVTLTPTADRYVAGRVVSATLHNQSGIDIGYGLCSGTVEHLTAAGWVVATPGPRGCLDIQYVASPGTTAAISFPLDSTFEPGTYRLRLEILPDTSLPSQYIYSGKFVVEAGCISLVCPA